MAAISKTAICNLALARIGQDIQISDIEDNTENSKEARLCRLHYGPSLDKVLEDFPWNFSTRYVALAEVDVAPPPGWQYVYQYPTDALTIRKLLTEAGDRLPFDSGCYGWPQDQFCAYLNNLPKVPYQIIANAALDGRLIVTDLPEAYCVYTARVDSPQGYPSGFAKALWTYLASELCMPMSGNDERRTAILNEYVAMKDMAAANSLNEEGYDRDPMPTSYLARL